MLIWYTTFIEWNGKRQSNLKTLTSKYLIEGTFENISLLLVSRVHAYVSWRWFPRVWLMINYGFFQILCVWEREVQVEMVVCHTVGSSLVWYTNVESASYEKWEVMYDSIKWVEALYIFNPHDLVSTISSFGQNKSLILFYIARSDGTIKCLTLPFRSIKFKSLLLLLLLFINVTTR